MSSNFITPGGNRNSQIFNSESSRFFLPEQVEALDNKKAEAEESGNKLDVATLKYDERQLLEAEILKQKALEVAAAVRKANPTELNMYRGEKGNVVINNASRTMEDIRAIANSVNSQLASIYSGQPGLTAALLLTDKEMDILGNIASARLIYEPQKNDPGKSGEEFLAMEVTMNDGTEIAIRKNVDLTDMTNSTIFEKFSVEDSRHSFRGGKPTKKVPIVRQTEEHNDGSIDFRVSDQA
jgi:hypothetical protein